MPIATQRFVAADLAAAEAKINTLSMVTAAEDAALTAVAGVVDAEGRDLLVTITTDVAVTGSTFETRRITVDVESVLQA